MAQLPSTRVLINPELLRKIMEYISGFGSAEAIFTLQRVNRLFLYTINDSALLKIKMGVRQACGPTTQHHKLYSSRLCPFIIQGRLDLHQFAFQRQWTAGTAAPAHTTFSVPLKFMYFTTTDDREVMGMKGLKRRHSDRMGSWRDIKLLTSADPVTVQVYIEAISPPNFLRQRHPVVYTDAIRFDPEDATLGNLVDCLQEVRARSPHQHANIAGTASLVSRRWSH